MIRTIIYVALNIVIFTPLVFADSEYDRQLAALAAERDKAIAGATEPINRRYQAALEQLLRRATQSSDLEAAVKIKAALAAADPNSIGARFRGRWVSKDKSSRVVFTAGGNFQEFWNGGVQEGRWQPMSDTDAKVTLKKGDVHEYHLDDDGTSVKRQDGWSWNREK